MYDTIAFSLLFLQLLCPICLCKNSHAKKWEEAGKK